MVSIKAHAQKKKKKASKNNDSSVKEPKKVIPKYEITRARHIKSLKEPDIYPFSNQTILEDKFIKEYEGFFRFFLNTWNHLPRNRIDNFLDGYPFQTFEKRMIIRKRGNLIRKNLSDEEREAQFVQKWNEFLVITENVFGDLDSELSQLATISLRPELSKFKKMLDITRHQAGKPRLKDNYLTAEGLPRF